METIVSPFRTNVTAVTRSIGFIDYFIDGFIDSPLQTTATRLSITTAHHINHHHSPQRHIFPESPLGSGKSDAQKKATSQIPEI
ncbi:hypothetical protein [Bifidobacterium callitrichos]|uniref:hypothetical protein n=1 Tax=Bifidobacterium callitrichos TaxID=762209 RepID=UPI0011B25ADD|nr:hypothetical protein [Bifidobacterium callitrichos]